MIYDAIIVGGGIAGLTAAAFLSKSGRRVLLCEKQPKCGGLVNTFERDGFVFDGGIRALDNAGALFPMVRQLGIQMKFMENPVTLGIEDRVIRFDSDDSADTYAEFLTRFYPDSKAEIHAIVREIKKIMKYMDVQYGIDNPLFLDVREDREYFIKKVFPWLFRYAGTVRKIMSLNMPVEKYLETFTDDRALLDIIAQHFFTATPAFFALSYIKLYMDYHYPRGGTGVLPDKLVRFIMENGGEIKTNAEIQKLDLPGKTVVDRKGNEFNYHQLLWAADMKHLYQRVETQSLADPKLVNRIREKRESLKELDGNNSILTLYLESDLEPAYFEGIASGHFFYTPSRAGQSQAGTPPIGGNWKEIQSWIRGFLPLTTYEISIPALRDEALAPPGKTGLIISLLFDYKLARRIEVLKKYDDFKRLAENQMIQVLDNSIYPGLKNSVIAKFSSTPLTIEELTNSTGGAITGWAFTNEWMPSEYRLPRIANAVNTPLPDVWQAGQWTFSPSGLPISLITGKLAADKINKRLK